MVTDMSNDTMHAVIIRGFGGTEVLEVATVPVPEPGPGQVRVTVEAATVNPADLATRAGILAGVGLMVPGPITAIGCDAAGTVDAVGHGARRFSPGDRVIGLRDRLTDPGGAQAGCVVLDESAVARAPRTAAATEASTLPLNGLTASQSLDLLALSPGAWLLVTGAAGAVGGFAVELAVLRGLRVVAVARAGDEELVRSFGAEEFIAASDDLGTAVRAVVPGGVDGALDAAVIGVAALDAVRGGGAFVAVVAGGAPAFPLRGTRIHHVLNRADGVRLGELAALVDAGRLTLRVAGTYPLAQVAKAHERLAAGGLRGRLVLEP
jgi:NADPH:quinone reductase-like Zn-dependent oxidoreductase